MQRPSTAETSAVIGHAMLRIRTDQAERRGDVQEMDRHLAVLTDLLGDLQLNPRHLEQIIVDQNATYKTRADAACHLVRLREAMIGPPPDAMRKALSELSVIARAQDDAEVHLAIGNLAEGYGLDPEAETNRRTTDMRRTPNAT